MQWLKSAGLINIAYNISIPELPLSGYSDPSQFKVYMLDAGLFGAMLNPISDIIIKPETLFKKYNGAFIENYVAQELTANYAEYLLTLLYYIPFLFNKIHSFS